MSLCWIALPPFVTDDLRVCAIAAVFAHQQILFIRDNAVTALLAGALDLAAHVNFAVLQQLDGLPIGQPVFQVDIEAVQQMQVVQMQIRQVERVQFRYGGSLPVRESFRPFPADARSGDTGAPKGMALRFAAAAAGRFLRAGCTAVRAANGWCHRVSSLSFLVYFLDGLVLLKNIKCMVGASYHILSFTSCQMILYIQVIYLIIHMFNFFPHKMSVAICCDKMKRCYIEFLT